jgi:ABC-type multidrug transport system fused ATPase/permease subunit
MTRAATASTTARPRLARREEEAHMRPFQWPIMKRIMSYVRPYLGLYLLALACHVTLALIELVPPCLMKRAYDVDIKNGDKTGLVITAGLFLATMVGFYFAAMGVHWLTRYVSEMAVRDMRRDVFNKIQTLDIATFDRTPVGRLITRGTGDLGVLMDVLGGVLPAFVRYAVTLLGASALMLWMNPRLFILVAAAAPALYVASTIFRRRARPAWRRVRRDVSRLTANVAEMVSGVRVIQAFTREDENLDRFDDLNVINWRSNMRVARYTGWYLMSVEAIVMTCLAALLGWGGWLIAAGTLTVGTLIAFYQLMERMFEPARELAPLYNRTLHAMASGERVFGLLDIAPRIHDAPEAVDLGRAAGHVSFDHVGFEYVPGRPVLHDISFEAPAATTVALVGHTGCGKTTIVSLLNRFYDVTTGAIRVDGHDVRQISQASLHCQTAVILQENFLFDGSVMDNLKYARPEVSDEQVMETTKLLGCHEIFEGLAQGYHTQVGERGEGLSAGQRQLVSIARAMIAEPRILVLDEATSSVDTRTELAIQYALERLLQRRTCFIVAHRLSTVRRADQIIVLDHGRIVERGKHGDLLARAGVYARLHKEFVTVAT